MQFVPYSPPPVQPSSASPLDHGVMEQWIERMSFISEDLKWLLSLPHNKFWCQVKFSLLLIMLEIDIMCLQLDVW